MNEQLPKDVPEKLTHDPISGLDPKDHGHLTGADLYQEILADEAAGKREDAHLTAPMLRGGKAETPVVEKDQGLER